MRHIAYEKWVSYVINDVDEKSRDKYEEHLVACDECLELYLKAVESHADMLPKLDDNFTDRVLDHVTEKTNPKKNDKTLSFFQKPFFHYVIAAAMTLILMSSGLFGQLTQVASHIEERAYHDQSQSFTEGLIEKTLSFIKIFEGNKEVK